MKTQLFKSISILILTISLFSCAQSNDYSDISYPGDIWLTLGFLETENTNGYDYVIYCDNGDTLYPASSSSVDINQEARYRVIVNYTILQELNSTGKQYEASINDLQEVLYKELIQVNEQNIDSLGNDEIAISNLWIVNNLLNIEFVYYGDGYHVHYINLGFLENDLEKYEGPIQLELFHNGYDDEGVIPLNGIVTFNLENLKIDSRNSIEIEISAKGFNNQSQVHTGTYNY